MEIFDSHTHRAEAAVFRHRSRRFEGVSLTETEPAPFVLREQSFTNTDVTIHRTGAAYSPNHALGVLRLFKPNYRAQVESKEIALFALASLVWLAGTLLAIAAQSLDAFQAMLVAGGVLAIWLISIAFRD